MGYDDSVRGGVARWKRGVAGHGLRAAIAYALDGKCDATVASSTSFMTAAEGIDAAASYAENQVTRHVVNAEGGTTVDALDRDQLRAWIDGRDPHTRETRGRIITGANADLVLDATVNTPKSLSVAAMLDPELAAGVERLHDKIRDRALTLWQSELNARRGAGGRQRMGLAQIEVVELHHEHSRALDPHLHRHLWLNAKVLGTDGKWSNVDSRVMLRFQTLLNAEGDVATATDPEWRALLAAKGLTVDAATGEIAELAHLTGPLSRRSRQIETARAAKLAEWRDNHPGLSPAPEDLRAIDQWAWSYGRPGKPSNYDETTWRDTVLEEIADIDRGIAAKLDRGLAPVVLDVPAIADLDRDRLALSALAEADARSTSASGRFSEWDVRASAERAISRTGVSADRQILDELIDDVTQRVIASHVIDLAEGDTVPPHLRQFVASDTATAKAELDARLAVLGNGPAVSVATEDVTAVAANVTDHGLDDAQTAAAASVAGSGRLVTVVGPAGAGKTTMLRVARHLLDAQGRRALIVAPTKKAASVAGRETSMSATSVHGLLYEFGWRWHDDEHGRPVWHRLQPGDPDPRTGEIWEPRDLAIDWTTRIIVDEAGMVDVHSARALATLVDETGASVAFVGDPLQVMPVGHGGAMALAQRHAATDVELESIHRFRRDDGTADTGWAELTRRLRRPETDEAAAIVAAELLARDRVRIVANSHEATTALVEAWTTAHGNGESAAIVVATNEEARTINEAIQEHRLESRQLSQHQSVDGIDDQRIFVGDIVQTRQNDRQLGVENRAMWRVTRIKGGEVTLTALGVDDTHRTVPRAYASDNLQLAYATTVHGIQGETVQRAIVGPDVDAAGLYVGLTRGRRSNEVVVVAGDERSAATTLAEQMRRGQTEATLAESREALLREFAVAATRGASADANATDSDSAAVHWSRRKYGRLTDLDGAIAEAESRVPHSHETVQALRDKAEYFEANLRDHDRDRAVALATSDLEARNQDSTTKLDAERAVLQAQLAESRERLTKLQTENAAPLRLLDALHAERNIRQLVLSPEQRQQETWERTQTVVRPQSRTTDDYQPVVGDQLDRGHSLGI